ncbi:MAG: glycoside hydrolase family 130 protein [Bacteroidetes bacterium]|nr:glycoside hydrolase family 130 protein [Bacteroidota bacterium]
MTTHLKLVYYGLLTTLVLSCQQAQVVQIEQDVQKSWTMTGFVKVDSINPILSPQSDLIFDCPVSNTPVRWEERNVLNPTAVVKDNQVHLIYRAQDNAMTSRLGLAVSNDGLHFEKQPAPIFYPSQDSMLVYEWPGGVEDPRIVESEDGNYVLTYTAYDGKIARLCLAMSTDLRSWTKYGPVLSEEKYQDTWSKSGAIVSSRKGNRIVATKIMDRYWMYFGDTDLFIASSADLINWEVAENKETQEMISVLHPRMGYFDSRLVEPGPYALLKEEGILLIYNASNAANFSDPLLPKFTYAAGQALYDKDEPFKLIDRMDSYFIHPEKDYEKVGEVNEVCFVEGLVYFKGRWFLYYGTADSKIAVAVK